MSGSRGIRELPAEAGAALDKIKDLGFTVLVGDCHNLGFPAVRVAGSRQADKDAAMAADADYGLAVRDSRCPGTAKNIERVKATKVVRV